jgi:hypothetical protein
MAQSWAIALNFWRFVQREATREREPGGVTGGGS